MDIKSIMRGLDEAVQISDGKMKGRKHKMSISPVADYSNNEIRLLRNKLALTQLTFAKLLGVSEKTVEAWEKGTNKPNGPARRIIGMLKEDPQLPERLHLISM